MTFLAFRHLLSRKKQTLFILLGVMLGTMVYVFIAGTQLGFREFILERLIENDGHLKISGREEFITTELINHELFEDHIQPIWTVPPAGKRDEAKIMYPISWINKLNHDPDVVAASEQFSVQILASKGGGKVNAQLIGIVPAKHRQVTVFEKYMTAGSLGQLNSSGNRIIVGEGFLKKIGARLNDSILISSSTSAPTPFKIVGTFSLGVAQMDDSFIYGALKDVQTFNKTPGRISQIAVRLVDVDLAKEKSAIWGANSIDKVQSWDEANASFLEVFKIQDIFRNFITIGILVIAAFGIYNVLSIIVNQKRKEIAILQSLGYGPADIRILFMIQGLFIGVIGSSLGLLGGYYACSYLSQIKIEGLSHGLTVSFSPAIYIQGLLMAIGSSLFASFLPANAAARMQPIEIIRSEGG